MRPIVPLNESDVAWLRASCEASGVPFLIPDHELPRLADLLADPPDGD